MIDGYDISKVDLSSSVVIGIVPQDSLLWGTVSLYFLNDPDASAEENVEAAAAHDFIMTLPDGYVSTF